MNLRITYIGRDYDLNALPGQVEVPDGASLDDALAMLSQRLAAGGGLPASCLVAVSGKHLGTVARHRAQTLQAGDELTLLAPVAGG